MVRTDKMNVANSMNTLTNKLPTSLISTIFNSFFISIKILPFPIQTSIADCYLFDVLTIIWSNLEIEKVKMCYSIPPRILLLMVLSIDQYSLIKEHDFLTN